MSNQSNRGNGQSPVIRWVIVISGVIVLLYLCISALGMVKGTLEEPDASVSSQSESVAPEGSQPEPVEPEPPVVEPEPPVVEPEPPVVEPEPVDPPAPQKELLPYVDGAGLSVEEKMYYIHNSSAYPDDMIAFADKYTQVLDYVYDYPVKKGITQPFDLSGVVPADKMPLYIQWDERWGYTPFGDLTIGTDGCGPVCLSMVATFLHQDASWDPVKVCKMTMDGGYYMNGVGSKWSLMDSGVQSLGLKSNGVGINEADMKGSLDAGRPMVASVRKGDFTKAGHFIVITGYNENGFTVNDPNSPANSAKTWSFDRLQPQIRALWGMSLA